MILDYSQDSVAKSERWGWLRVLWSQRARRELAQRISARQAVGVVASVSLVAAGLNASQLCLQTLVARSAQSQESLVQAGTLWRDGLMALWTGLTFAGFYFLVLAGLLVLMSIIAARRMRPRRSWSHCFPVFSVGSVPLLWFFVLLQLEGVAPFISRPVLWSGFWNPVTNLLRFGVLMVGIVLLAVWIVEAGRLYLALVERSAAECSAGGREEKSPHLPAGAQEDAGVAA